MSGIPAPSEERRIIPLRTRLTAVPPGVVAAGESDPQPHATSALAAPTREDPVRHYLKFMLPAIPIVTFVLTFVYGYVLLGLYATAPATTGAELSSMEGQAAGVSPVLPLCGATLLGMTTGALSMLIYFGYLRVRARTP